MKSLSLAALLLSTATLVALAPPASAIIHGCLPDEEPVQCVTVFTSGPFCVDADGAVDASRCLLLPPAAGVCVEGVQVAGTACTVDVPVYDDVCLGDYRPFEALREAPRRCFDTRGTVWFESCGGGAYSLRADRAVGRCMGLP